MAGYASSTSAAGPRTWAFLQTGPAIQTTLAASTITFTLNQYVTTAPYASQCAFWNVGAAAANSHAFVAFGSTAGTVAVTVAATSGVPIVSTSQMSQGAGTGGVAMQVLSTGKSPSPILAIGSAGTATIWIIPGEGGR